MNAIILAAGMGSRLMPLTADRPKALVEISGKAIIESQIDHLITIGVRSIVIVGGYQQAKLVPIASRYPAAAFTFLKNTCYEIHNNFCSMYAAREFLDNSYVLDGDVFLPRNILLPSLDKSVYFIGDRTDAINEWTVSCDPSGRIVAMSDATGAHPILTGISYWTRSESAKIRELMIYYKARRDFANIYWDNIVRENLDKIEVYRHNIETNDWYEIDNCADIERLQRRGASPTKRP